MTPIVCTGCGTPTGSFGNETPVPDSCQNCPPKRCEDCGEMSHADALCPCWQPLAELPHADVKAMFADMGLNVNNNTGEIHR